MCKFRYFMCCLLISLIVFSNINVYAKEEEKEKDKDIYKSTIQLTYGYMFDDGSMDVFASAPGVVINSRTVITYDFRSVDIQDQFNERRDGYEAIGVDIYDSKNKPEDKLQFAVYSQEEKNANFISVNEFEEVETEAGIMLILYTEEDLDYSVLFSPQDELVEEEDEFYATGLKNDIKTAGTYVDYLSEDGWVYISSILFESQKENLIKFNIDADFIFEGGAIINQNNELCGITLFADTNRRWGTAVPVGELKEILKTHNVMYTVSERALPVDYTMLHTVTDAAEQIDEQIVNREIAYTEDSEALFTEKFVNAKKISDKKDVTQEEVDQVASELDDAIRNLEPVSKSRYYNVIIILVVICLVVILIIVISFLYIEKRELLFKLLGVKQKGQNTVSKKKKYVKGNKNSLNDDIVGAPYIIRVVDGSKIVIDKDGFTIGRDFGVDCRIPDNISVSKCHCKFNKVGDQWFIVDNNSSNKTFVNNYTINPNEPVALYDKAEIMLGNEKFVFRYLVEPMNDFGETDLNDEVPDTGILSNDENNEPIAQTPFFTYLDQSEMDTTVLPGAQESNNDPWA